MITVKEALSIIAKHTTDFGIWEIPLDQATSSILREDIVADRDIPPYDRVTMDGIVIRFEDFMNGNRRFKITGVAAAGASKQNLHEKNGCLEVMTGSVMPDGADTVIPYEQVLIEAGYAVLATDAVGFRQNIHFRGMDRKKGEVVISPGIQLSSSEIGVCATVGKAQLKVSRLPKTLVVSSGDELVEINQKPKAHEIRRSNVYRIVTDLKNFNIKADTAHILDDYDQIIKKLEKYLREYELIILSGGVSKGKYDFLPKALEQVGVVKHFHRIKQRPGKPFWFGTYRNRSTVFAFPGNPVSSFLCMAKYFNFWLQQCLQLKNTKTPRAKLTKAVNFEPDLTYFLEVKLDYSNQGELLATPVKGNGSGDLANLVDADAFIQLPEDRNKFESGEVFPVTFYR